MAVVSILKSETIIVVYPVHLVLDELPTQPILVLQSELLMSGVAFGEVQLPMVGLLALTVPVDGVA